MNLALRNGWVRDPLLSFMDDVVNDFFVPRTAAVRGDQSPLVAKARVDVIDRGAHFEIAAELPGVAKNDIKVQIEGKRVSIEATAKVEREVKEGEALLHSERYATHYARSFALPVELDSSNANARYENGLLTLTVPKKEASKPSQITVQ